MDQKKMKRCTSRVQELISTEELVSLVNLKAEIERKEKNTMAAIRNISGFYYIFCIIEYSRSSC